MGRINLEEPMWRQHGHISKPFSKLEPFQFGHRWPSITLPITLVDQNDLLMLENWKWREALSFIQGNRFISNHLSAEMPHQSCMEYSVHFSFHEKPIVHIPSSFSSYCRFISMCLIGYSYISHYLVLYYCNMYFIGFFSIRIPYLMEFYLLRRLVDICIRYLVMSGSSQVKAHWEVWSESGHFSCEGGLYLRTHSICVLGSLEWFLLDSNCLPLSLW